MLNVYKCSKAEFTSTGIKMYEKSFENGKEIKIDQSATYIKEKMNRVINKTNNSNTIYLTYGMRDIDITYDFADQTWALCDEYEIFLFTLDL